ncbi:hypothetical protein KIN20_035835 [Parelaphostrongylus tenuis]|uniref:Uncharacterized protein n=1 Tax=Parelaphostrongylus tenuis TaxID=148309 RepID=A0AAD5RF81_PARTN|nr:hypothetical protein KIN20_035835 [Parelaphostrongylus tenuis]
MLPFLIDPWRHPRRAVQKSYLSDVESMMEVRQVKTVEESTSSTLNLVPYYLHTISQDKLKFGMANKGIVYVNTAIYLRET